MLIFILKLLCICVLYVIIGIGVAWWDSKSEYLDFETFTIIACTWPLELPLIVLIKLFTWIYDKFIR